MVNEAYILSNTGLAFFKEGRQWYTLRADAPDAPRPLHTFDRNTINLGNSEVLHLNEPHQMEALQAKLKQQTALQDTLTASLQLMDPRIKRSSTKQLLVSYLMERFRQPDFLDFVQHRFWSVPLPAAFDPKEALSHINDSGEQKELLQLYTQLEAEREAISQFDVCWKKTAYQSKQIEDQDSVERIHHTLVDGGWVKAFIGSIHRRSKKEWDAAVLGSTLLLQNQGMKVNALLFADLLKELKRTYAIVLEDSSHSPPEMNEETSTKAPDPIQMMISRYLEEYSGDKKERRYVKGDYSKRAKKKKKRNFDYHDSEKVQRNVDYLSDKIAERVTKGKFVSAESYLKQLLEAQFATSSPEQICKSLCNVAERVKRHYAFVHRILHYAIQLNSEDTVPYNQLAEALKIQGKLDEAKVQFEQNTRQFPNDDVSRNGLAEVLKAQSKLDEAKVQFEENARQFPNDAFSRNGLAEVLKAQGRLDEAKDLFEKTINDFPHNVVARTGLAEVLKAQGRLDEAKDLFEKTISDFPNDVVPRNGLAEVLKAQGRLDEAKAAYRSILEVFPNNDYAQHALAALHLQLDERSAFEALMPKSLTTPVSITDYYWDHLAITNLIKQGDWDKAEERIYASLKRCPFHNQNKVYQRTLKYLNIQKQQFDQLFDELSELNDTPVDHLINTHAYAVTNQTEKAKAALERCKVFKDMQLIYETSCLLSERFDINGLPRQGLSTAELDRQIREKELMAITIIQ